MNKLIQLATIDAIYNIREVERKVSFYTLESNGKFRIEIFSIFLLHHHANQIFTIEDFNFNDFFHDEIDKIFNILLEKILLVKSDSINKLIFGKLLKDKLEINYKKYLELLVKNRLNCEDNDLSFFSELISSKRFNEEYPNYFFDYAPEERFDLEVLFDSYKCYKLSEAPNGERAVYPEDDNLPF